MSGSSWLLVSILFIAIPPVICCVDMMSCYDYFSVPSGVDEVNRAVTRLSHTEVVTVTMSDLCVFITVMLYYRNVYRSYYPIGRPVRATITLYPIGRPVRATITLYPIGRPVRGLLLHCIL